MEFRVFRNLVNAVHSPQRFGRIDPTGAKDHRFVCKNLVTLDHFWTKNTRNTRVSCFFWNCKFFDLVLRLKIVSLNFLENWLVIKSREHSLRSFKYFSERNREFFVLRAVGSIRHLTLRQPFSEQASK